VRPGRRPQPRLYLSDPFLAALAADQRPRLEQARGAGWAHPAEITRIEQARSVPAGSPHVRRLKRLAQAIDFDPALCFEKDRAPAASPALQGSVPVPSFKAEQIISEQSKGSSLSASVIPQDDRIGGAR
jgi:hypothetical protein